MLQRLNLLFLGIDYAEFPAIKAAFREACLDESSSGDVDVYEEFEATTRTKCPVSSKFGSEISDECAGDLSLVRQPPSPTNSKLPTLPLQIMSPCRKLTLFSFRDRINGCTLAIARTPNRSFAGRS